MGAGGSSAGGSARSSRGSRNSDRGSNGYLAVHRRSRAGRPSRTGGRWDRDISLLTTRVSDPDETAPAGAVSSGSSLFTAPNPADKETLSVTDVHFNIRENTRDHYTDVYDITDVNQGSSHHEYLVIRRGQEFNIEVVFNRPYQQGKDDLRLVFQFGATPMPPKGTHVEIILSAKDTAKGLSAWIKSASGNSIVVTIRTTATFHVGKWKFRIDVIKRKDADTEVFRYKHPDPIYMLFNPWFKDDQVYLSDKALLEECVLRDTGYQFYGTYKRIGSRVWTFGQFEDVILDCVLYLLDQGMKDAERGDVAKVVRKLTALVNGPGDNGVLEGNWSGDYKEGTSPLFWSGSVGILEEYYRTKKTVKFGQCWVFSGVLTTVLRALGIPTRSITNYSSAHDTDGSITIDKYFGPSYERLETLNQDSTWNFHVWNEAWMARPDLPPGYGGWQAVDATPQELSDNVYCCGPTSVQAIKQGNVHYPYDGQFVFAEVNADKLDWQVRESGEYILIGEEKHSVGLSMSTTKPGTDERLDVTRNYKHEEGSEEERAAVMKANLFSSRPDHEAITAWDVVFDIEYNHNDTFIGDDLSVTLVIENTSDEVRYVDATMELASMYYTGVTYRKIKTEKLRDFKIGPKSAEKYSINITQDGYMDKLTDHCNCVVSVVGKANTGQMIAANMELRLRKPHLTIKAPSKAKVGEKFKTEISFKNPLNTTMTNCEVRIEGPGLQKPRVEKQSNVPAGSTFVYSFDMTPAKTGARRSVIVFNSSQISAITGNHDVSVSK